MSRKRRSRGEGSLFYHDHKGLWVSQITLPNGKRRIKYSKKQSIVREWLQTAQNELRQGFLPANDVVTIGEFLTHYFETVGRETLRPRTQEMYASFLKVHIIPSLGRIKLKDLRPSDLQELYTKKLQSGLSRRSVQILHGIIRRCLNQAVSWGVIPRNVCHMVKAPRPDKKAPAFYTSEQIKALLEAVKDHPYRLIYVLLCSGGFREGEVLGIHIEDWDGKNRTVNVRHTVVTLKGGMVISEPKTQSSKRAVVLPKSVAHEVNRYIEQLNRKQGLIFTTRSGKPISPRNFIRHFKSVIKPAGLPDLSVHGLRHSHASLLLAEGVNPKIVQERLGHTSIALTLQLYSHTSPSLQDMAADKLEDLFAPA
jgi:integrase